MNALPPPYDIATNPVASGVNALPVTSTSPLIGNDVTPQTLSWVRSHVRSAKLYLTQSDSSTAQNIPEGVAPAYSIHMPLKNITLYSGDPSMKSNATGAANPRPLIDVEGEGYFNSRSTYYDSDSPVRRSVLMCRATKEHYSNVKADGIFSKNRTFEDFDGNLYKWHTFFFGDQQCVRLSDGAIVASFKRAKMSLMRHGDFTLHQSVPEKTLHLLLATCAMCYVSERRRRRHQSSGGGGGGGP